MPKFERCVVFSYSHEEALEDAEKLEDLLQENNIDFVYYNDKIRQLFKVKRSGKKWNDIYELINSVKAAKYHFENACIENGTEYIFC